MAEGNKCKLVIVFRGREIVHPETGQAMLDKVVKAVNDIAMVEQRPMMEGRRMVMIIGPRGGVIRPPGPTVPAPVRPAAAAPAPAAASAPTNGATAPAGASGGGSSAGSPPAQAAAAVSRGPAQKT